LDELFAKLKEEPNLGEEKDSVTNEIEKLIVQDFLTDLESGENEEELH